MSRRSATPLFPYHHGYRRDWRGRPPHMTPAEAILFFWWLDRWGTDIDEVWYDVPMDGIAGNDRNQPRPAASQPPVLQRMWQRLTSKRCDAITRVGTCYRIIEMRKETRAQTLGELHTYQSLAKSEWPELTFLETVLVTQSVNPIDASVIRQSNIIIHQAPKTLVLPTARGYKSLASKPLDSM